MIPIYNKNSSLLKIKKSNISGRGLFTFKSIEKGEVICFMKGKSISIPKIIKKYGRNKSERGKLLQIGSKKYLKLFYPYYIINHSCNPNSAIINRNKLIAIKSIEKGEEILYDYSATIYEDQNDWPYKLWTMKCKCQSKNCRGLVAQFYNLPKNIQKRYLETRLLQNYVLKLYKNNKYISLKV